MTWLYSRNLHSFISMAALASIGTVGWATWAEAAPQLRYRTVQLGGTVQTCLDQAETAMATVGFANPATTASEVIGENGGMSATVACQALSPQQFQATVMVAAAETVAPAVVTTRLDTLTTAMTSPGSGNNPSAGPTGQQAMDDEAFNQLMTALENSWPDYLEFLAQPVSTNYFTAEQASQIVDTMRFADEEVDAAVMLYPRVVDPGNWYVVEQAISFESSRQELRQRLSGE
jgi:hypothetical protein